ncbi:MAG: proline dehydrogenase family protein [Flavobacteriales bacterium]|nr:proline dehydrogenase family protein [Flavobacteriales bacterium]
MSNDPVSFSNTEVAFSSKSDGELLKAYYLFKLISSPWLVNTGKVLVNIALKLRIPIGWAIRGNVFKQFCGGENIAQCARATRVLDKFHIGTILDYSVEGKESEADLDHTCQEIMRTLETAKGNPHIPFSVFKVTGISRFALLEKINAGSSLNTDEQAEWQRVRKRVDNICALAHSTGTPIFIDAEDSWIQDAIDGLAEEMMEKYNKNEFVIYTTAQLYRHDRLEYLKQLHQRAKKSGYKVGVKLVRGAYMEKERRRAAEMGYRDPIQPDKLSSDRDFDLALEYCVEHINDIAICCGSHNEESSLKLVKLIEARGLQHNDKRIYFAQLFGMSDHISFNLAHAGFNVAKYVPYGPIREVIPYLIRRAQENTSVKGQTGRELSLIIAERKRRKGQRA